VEKQYIFITGKITPVDTTKRQSSPNFFYGVV